MQEIIKQVGSSRQLFETVNFAFMKIFDFLVKTALFGAFLLFLGDSCHKLRPKIELSGCINVLIMTSFFRLKCLEYAQHMSNQ